LLASIHVLQLTNTDKFQQYNYGHKENLKRYNRSTPPEYPLKTINAPLVLVFSEIDMVATPSVSLSAFGEKSNYKKSCFKIFSIFKLFSKGFQKLSENLKNLIYTLRIPKEQKYSHFGYIYFKNAKQIVYDKLIELMLKH